MDSGAKVGMRRCEHIAVMAKRFDPQRPSGNMQSACDTPSSHSLKGVIEADRSQREACRAEAAARGELGRQQPVAKERVLTMAGTPGRIRERHVTLIV